jgi:hypothetical protein
MYHLDNFQLKCLSRKVIVNPKIDVTAPLAWLTLLVCVHVQQGEGAGLPE